MAASVTTVIFQMNTLIFFLNQVHKLISKKQKNKKNFISSKFKFQKKTSTHWRVTSFVWICNFVILVLSLKTIKIKMNYKKLGYWIKK